MAEDLGQAPAAALLQAGEPGRPRRWPTAIGLAALLGVLAVGVGWLVPRPEAPKSVRYKVVPLTSFTGKESFPSFSPDGNYVAFCWDGENQDNADIYVQLIGSGTPLRLTTDPADDCYPGWSPDGRQIAFLRLKRVDPVPVSEVILVPPLGGPERRLSEIQYAGSTQYGTGISWSPDGKFIAVPDRNSHEEPLGIHLLSIDTGEKKRLTSPLEWTRRGDIMPLFSPDGRAVVFERFVAWGVSDIHIVPVTAGEATRLTFLSQGPRGMAWTPDGQQVVFSRRHGLWKVSRDGGTPQPLSGLGENAVDVAISSKENRLAYTRRTFDSDIWRLDTQATDRSGSAEFISSTRNESNPQFSPDGKQVVFASDRGGTYEIWICGSDGSNCRQATSMGETGSPRWSPDGQTIAFDSTAGGNPDIYVISAGGGTPRRITSSSSEDVIPSWSGDGRWIYFSSSRSEGEQIWKAPVEGEADKANVAVQLTRQGGRVAFESADGEFVFYSKRTVSSATTAGRASAIWRVSVQGGDETLILDEYAGNNFGWALGRKGIYFLDLRDRNSPDSSWVVKLLDLEEMRSTEVAELTYPPHPGRGPGLTVSPDGRWILGGRVKVSADLMLVENFH